MADKNENLDELLQKLHDLSTEKIALQPLLKKPAPPPKLLETRLEQPVQPKYIKWFKRVAWTTIFGAILGLSTIGIVHYTEKYEQIRIEAKKKEEINYVETQLQDIIELTVQGKIEQAKQVITKTLNKSKDYTSEKAQFYIERVKKRDTALNPLLKQLAETDRLFNNNRETYENLPKPDIDASRFENLKTNLIEILSDYQKLKTPDRIKKTQTLFTDLSNSVQSCKDNKKNKIRHAKITFIDYTMQHLSIVKDTRIKYKPKLVELKSNLEILAKTYNYLGLDTKPINELAPQIENSINSCRYMEKKLSEADKLFEQYKKDHQKLPIPDVEPKIFEKPLSELQKILSRYQESKIDEKTKQVQNLITDVNRRINESKANDKKRQEFVDEFAAIRKLAEEQKHNQVAARIKDVAAEIEKEKYPLARNQERFVKNFEYKKSVYFPQKIAKTTAIEEAVETFYMEPLGWKKSVRSSKGKKLPVVKHSTLENPLRKEFIIHPYSEKETYIKTLKLPHNPEKYSNLEKSILVSKFMNQGFSFDSTKRSTESYYKLSAVLGEGFFLGLDQENGSVLVKLYKPYKDPKSEKTLHTVIWETEIAVSKYATGQNTGKDIGTKSVSSYSDIQSKDKNKYLILVPKTCSAKLEIKDRIITYTSGSEEKGLLRIDIRIDGWGPIDRRRRIIAKKYADDKLYSYKYTKIEGIVGISYQPKPK